MIEQYDSDYLKKNFFSIGVNLNDQQISQFLLYYDTLIEWNSFMNLTTIVEYEDVVKKHFVDSVSLMKAVFDLNVKDYSIIDIGTGAGFPGIPLKIVFPNLNIVLLDSLNKRINFLNHVISVLELKNITAIHGRAEDIARQADKRENFDLCVSRAVANLSVLSEYCIPFVKNNGYFISYKSEKVKEECDKAKTAINVLGGKYEKQIDFFLPESDIYRNLIVIKKIRSTPAKFPRKAGVPTKEPILT